MLRLICTEIRTLDLEDITTISQIDFLLNNTSTKSCVEKPLNICTVLFLNISEYEKIRAILAKKKRHLFTLIYFSNTVQIILKIFNFFGLSYKALNGSGAC